MNIGIFTTSFRPYQWYSGISNVVYLMSRRLHRKYGHDVTIFLPNEGGKKRTEVHNDFTIERFDTINIHKQRGFYVAPEAMNISRKFDLVHSFHYGYFPATAGLANACRSGAPHIFTAAYHPPGSFLGKNLMRAYNTFYGRKILAESSTVIPFNNNEKKQLAGISKGNYKVIPCPLNHDIFRPKKSKTGKLTLAFVGAMEPWKGPQIAFDIFKQIEKERKDVRFIFVGNGLLKHQDALYQKLKSQAGKNFTFTRNLSVKQLAKVYKTADVMVQPTAYESFGYILAESLSCGTPVVSTKVGAVPETVGNGGLLVDYGNWAGMKENTMRLLDDSRLRKKLGRNAVKHSRQYRDDYVVRQIQEVYRTAQ